MYQGVVQRISTKPWGNKTFYSFALSGQDGWFNMGMKKPPLEGSSVQFEAKPNQRGFLEVDTKTLKAWNDGEAGSATLPKVSSLPGTGSAGTKSPQEKGYWERREAREVRNDSLRELGASRNTALAVIDVMVKNEAIKLPAIAKREQFFWELIERYTNKLMGKNDGAAAPAETELTSVAAPPTPAESEEWN